MARKSAKNMTQREQFRKEQASYMQLCKEFVNSCSSAISYMSMSNEEAEQYFATMSSLNRIDLILNCLRISDHKMPTSELHEKYLLDRTFFLTKKHLLEHLNELRELARTFDNGKPHKPIIREIVRLKLALSDKKSTDE